MSEYYTNIATQGNSILYRGVENGRRVRRKIEYSPTLFLLSNKESEWKGLFGENLEPRTFETIRDARDFIKKYEGVENFKVFGNDRYEYSFIAEKYPHQIDWDLKDISIAIIDIETGSENGFPDPYKATEPITAISISFLNGETAVFGCGDYVTQGKEVYHKCDDEWSLCKRFLAYWQLNYPDVVTGWNIDFFDIPYLVNRFNRIVGEDECRKLSPWNNVWERSFVFKGQEKKSYTISGVAALDYIELYKWYAPNGKSQDSYKLDSIANVELGESKLSYEEYDNLHQLYKLNFQKFIEYNIKDVDLIVQLEDKLKLLELALTLAYDTKTNFEDVFAQTRMWDSLIYCNLLEKKIVVPPKTFQKKDSAFEGAYVKEPQVGMHKWVTSWDLDSLYPHLLMMYNLSPETLIEPYEYDTEMRRIISDGVSINKLLNKSIDTSKLNEVTLTPNGQFFRTDKQGFLAKMMEDLYEDRKKFKKMMLVAKQEYENESDPKKKFLIEKKVARYNNLQLAKKLSLNSAYGVLGSSYFRFYDLRLATAVTQAGQLSILWIQHKLNSYMNKILKTTNEDFVVASDTDSIYLRLEELIDGVFDKEKQKDTAKIIDFMDKVCEEKIKPYIEKSYQELSDYVRAYNQKMRMKRECLADKGIWTAKKRYVLNVYNDEGVAYKEPEMKVKGLEMVKSSTPASVRTKMYEVVKLILTTDEQEVQRFIENFKEQFKSLPVEDISFPRGVNGIREYSDGASLYKKGTPIHVRGAILYNNLLDKKQLGKKYQNIKDGDKLKFTYLKMPNPIKESVISYPTRLPKEFELESFIDYETQFQKGFIEPIKVILDCIGWTVEKQNSIEDFFA